MTNQILLTLSQSLSGKNGRLLIGVGAISALTICSMLLDNGYSLETPKAVSKLQTIPISDLLPKHKKIRTLPANVLILLQIF